jgi:hypothetical protein
MVVIAHPLKVADVYLVCCLCFCEGAKDKQFDMPAALKGQSHYGSICDVHHYTIAKGTVTSVSHYWVITPDGFLPDFFLAGRRSAF